MALQQSAYKTEWPVNVYRPGWLGSETSKPELCFDMGPEQASALIELADKHLAAGRAYTTVTLEGFRHPALDPFLAGAVEALKWGKGVIFLRGIPVDGLTLEQVRMIFWGIGTHFGSALSQSVVGDMMGDVTPRPGSSRGYTGDQELGLHTDYTELGTLLCIQPSKAGGDNIFVSSLALWDVIEREHPEFMPILTRGFRTWRMDEHRENQEPVTPYHVPVFAEKNGLRSVYWSWLTADATARYLGEPLNALEMK